MPQSPIVRILEKARIFLYHNGNWTGWKKKKEYFYTIMVTGLGKKKKKKLGYCIPPKEAILYIP